MLLVIVLLFPANVPFTKQIPTTRDSLADRSSAGISFWVLKESLGFKRCMFCPHLEGILGVCLSRAY